MTDEEIVKIEALALARDGVRCDDMAAVIRMLREARRERDALRVDLDLAYAERDHEVRFACAAERERDEARRERDEAMAACRALIEQAGKERDAAVKLAAEADDERKRAVDYAAACMRSRDQAMSLLTDARNEIDAIRKKETGE